MEEAFSFLFRLLLRRAFEQKLRERQVFRSRDLDVGSGTFDQRDADAERRNELRVVCRRRACSAFPICAFDDFALKNLGRCGFPKIGARYCRVDHLKAALTP